jgi:hypothetical protein
VSKKAKVPKQDSQNQPILIIISGIVGTVNFDKNIKFR